MKNLNLEDKFEDVEIISEVSEVDILKEEVLNIFDNYSKPINFRDYVNFLGDNLKKFKKDIIKNTIFGGGAIGLVEAYNLFNQNENVSTNPIDTIIRTAGSFLIGYAVSQLVRENRETDLHKKGSLNNVIKSISKKNDFSREESLKYLKGGIFKYFEKLENFKNNKTDYYKSEENFLKKHMEYKTYKFLFNYINNNFSTK